VLFDGTTGQPRALKEKEVPPSNAVVYSLGAVMLFHSRKERGDPEPEFEGDSGGRYSICVNLGAQDGFYWIKRDDGESQPVRGPEGVALLETHCHSAFYDVEDSSAARACVGG
jgi:hypothetical protein